MESTKTMTKRLKYNDEIIETQDNQLWIYDDTHHQWIDISNPKIWRLINHEQL